MEQWHSCLAPVCQLALNKAYQTVVQRGGNVVTPEDLLLALLEVDTELAPFLMRWGIDQDELIRTIQAEQPLSAPAGSEDGLSDGLVDWFASARERHDRPWLSTHHLLSTLAHGAERFQDKAYVAVLEQVPAAAWDSLSLAPTLPGSEAELHAPREWVRRLDGLSVASFPLSASTHELATDIVTCLMEPVGGLIWLQAGSHSHVEGLLGQVRRMAQAVSASDYRGGEAVRRQWYQVDWERAGEHDGALEHLFEAMRSCCGAGPVVFLFQDCSPAVLTLFIERMGVLRWRHLLAVARPLIILSSPTVKHSHAPEAWLEDSLGLELRRFTVPLLSTEECLRYLRFCQPGIERKWQVEIADSALHAAACLAQTRNPDNYPDEDCADPETAVSLLQEALSTKVALQANGSAKLVELRSKREDLERRLLLAQARGEEADRLHEQLKSVCLEYAAEEVFWSEHGSPVASVLMRDDVVAQALRRAGVPLADTGENVRQTLPDLEYGVSLSVVGQPKPESAHGLTPFA